MQEPELSKRAMYLGHRTRVNVGPTFSCWWELGELKGWKTDAWLGFLLLNWLLCHVVALAWCLTTYSKKRPWVFLLRNRTHTCYLPNILYDIWIEWADEHITTCSRKSEFDLILRKKRPYPDAFCSIVSVYDMPCNAFIIWVYCVGSDTSIEIFF